MALMPAAAVAQDGSLLGRQYMLGDWWGVRSGLEAHGITPRAHYLSETAANPVGGQKQGAAYTQQVDVGADIDLGRLAGLTGGKIYTTFTARAGNSLAANDIGSLISVQEVFGSGQDVRFAELSYEQSLATDRLKVKLGWFHASDNFATSAVYCYFQNNGFCGQIGIVMNSGFTIFPTGSWAGMAKAWVRDDLYVQSGVFEVNPTLSQAPNGFKLGTSGATGVIIPSEAGWEPRFGPDGLQGHYKVGGYYDTSQAPYLGAPPGGPASLAQGRWGLYAMADQVVYRPSPDSPRNLTVFGVFSYAGPDTALLQAYWQLGLLKKGTFADRDEDTIGLAVNSSWVSNQLIAAQANANFLSPGSIAVQSSETTIELNYRAQVTPWFTLMPNLQYVIQPGAVTTIPNALVLGLQARLTF